MTQGSGSQNLYIQRNHVHYQDQCDIFRVKVKNYSTQYYPFYLARLKVIKPLILRSIEANLTGNYPVIKLCELLDHVEQKVILIGVLFKQMTKQPTILKEIAYEDNEDSLPVTHLDNYTDETDYLMLQDENECVKIIGGMSVQSLVTGVVVGLLGSTKSEGNEFHVEDCFYPQPPDPWPSVSMAGDTSEKYILLVSGLGFSREPSAALRASLDLLSNYLVGLLDTEDDDKPAKIIRLIIAGNLIGEKVKAHEEANDETFRKPWLRKSKPYTVAIMSSIDDYLFELGKSIDVEIMPGFTDVTNISLPQQPIHPIILPRSSVCSSIRSVTNPYSASFDSRLFMGNSGQPIDNIRQFSDLKDPLEIMERTLIWSHIAPTAPDTLNSYPTSEMDPFVIKHLPDVYFTGNQDKAGSTIKRIGSKEVRLISIPKFEKSFTGVLVNLTDLTCDYISFKKL